MKLETYSDRSKKRVWAGFVRPTGNDPADDYSYILPITNAFTERVNLAIREITRIPFGISYQTLRAKLLFSPANIPTISTARAVSALTPSSLCFNRKPCFPVWVQHTISTYEIEEL